MGAVASDRGLARVVLPHYQPDDLRALLAFEHPGAAENAGPFQDLIALSREYFNAREVSFAGLACDLPGERTFTGRVLRACRSIPYGQTQSYSWLATAAGNPDAARAAARAMAGNPLPLVIPCHRVTYADGRLGGFSAPGGEELKRRMLLLEKSLRNQ
jgi:methylated-DNA-[protein]-cysteine S-methyltransferase